MISPGFLTKEVNVKKPQIALLDFYFITESGKTISFTLNTGVSLSEGFYPNAISELKVNGLPIPHLFDLKRWDESGLTFLGFNWLWGEMYLGFTQTLTEQLPLLLDAYRIFTLMPEVYLWEEKSNSFKKDEYITNLTVMYRYNNIC